MVRTSPPFQSSGIARRITCLDRLPPLAAPPELPVEVPQTTILRRGIHALRRAHTAGNVLLRWSCPATRFLRRPRWRAPLELPTNLPVDHRKKPSPAHRNAYSLAKQDPTARF